jgi:ribulose-phosphate 3-epimerase
VAIRIYPSLLAADFVNIESELRAIASADGVHVDVMDNHFVDALTFGPQMVKRIRDVSPVPLDVHLMIDNPDRHAPGYAALGAHSVTFHVEAAKNSLKTVEAILAEGAKAAIALKPNTDLEPYLELFHVVDMVLIMTVEPGAGGQAFMTEMMPKVDRAAQYIRDNSLDVLLEVDGGITTTTLPIAHRSGADTFVAGSSVYGTGTPPENISALRATVA